MPGENVETLINVWNDISDVIGDVCATPPNVPIHAIYGVNCSTPITMIFETGDLDEQPVTHQLFHNAYFFF